MDYGQLLYAPLYATLGVDAVIRGVYFESVPIRAMDMTSGIEIGDHVGVKSIQPAAVVLATSITENGLSREDIEGASLELAAKLWRVKATMPKPSPVGEALGEIYLILEEDE